MIELYFWPTPNGYKCLIMLEELGLDYELKPVDIFKGEQHQPAFLKISPNGRIPAIIDTAPADGGPPLALFESGAILSYLASKSQRMASFDARGWAQMQQWVHWQIGGLGPMMGQAGHFLNYAPEDVAYARSRYTREARRLLQVLEAKIAFRTFITNDYSIADIASYPWVRICEHIQIPLADFPRLSEWAHRIGERPAVRRAYELGEPLKADQVLDSTARKALFPDVPSKS